MPNETTTQQQDDDNALWINCMVRETPKGFSIWIPKGAFGMGDNFPQVAKPTSTGGGKTP